MIKIEHTEVVGWEHAIRGMRNPMNSWEKSDSCFDCSSCYCIDCVYTHEESCDHKALYIGPNDHKLMMKLRNAGTDHRKFMRMIVVYLDITAPLYWWKEFETYRAGVKPGDTGEDLMDIEMNSCSTMHKIHAKFFTIDDFSVEHLFPEVRDAFENTVIKALNECRDLYLGCTGFEYKYGVHEKKDYWWQMIQLLPSSYNQRRTVMLNYEVLANMYRARKNHKLDEWREFCKWIEGLPYSELITGEEAENDA